MCSDRLFIGIDSNAENLARYSQKAAQKPTKGGTPNALFVHANCERLPTELCGVAQELSILLPWGSLLKAVVLPDLAVLQGLRCVCAEQATLRIVFGYDQCCEPGITMALDLPPLTWEYLQAVLIPCYAQIGFAIQVRQMEHTELRDIPTTWAKRLSYGKDREFFEIIGHGLS
ncbi:MAG: hypothetical protein GFH27_549285n55 [Chloroflexi bacterium AL-W]|nr:hypothetical protein [Chloroflexi bacterium AL-N1]NOK65567.1 hypothetical protein [Chloroflexi bacterium AL-N10]NOK74492.1 hypothetical protein [Chloroflexi bacterium AL-N5]NOK80600.1 hypothetical protein [Chloroflexi bacterium AL-W]NOK88750.1 hypothetical protein [Chloroflexi bacterium AL-N15]